MSLYLFLILSISYLSMSMIRINYMEGKVSILFNRNCFPKMKDFSGSAWCRQSRIP